VLHALEQLRLHDLVHEQVKTVALLVTASMVFVACGGKVDGPAGAGDAAPSGGSSTGPSPTPSPASSDYGYDGCPPSKGSCDPGDVEYRTEEDACAKEERVGCYHRQGFCGGGKTWCRFYNKTECADVFGCEQGWAEVESCAADFECKETTTCGHTMTCQKVKTDCESTQPGCGAKARRVVGSVSCPYEGDCFTISNECGVTIWCKRE
jgi:hypothetical protein